MTRCEIDRNQRQIANQSTAPGRISGKQAWQQRVAGEEEEEPVMGAWEGSEEDSAVSIAVRFSQKKKKSIAVRCRWISFFLSLEEPI